MPAGHAGRAERRIWRGCAPAAGNIDVQGVRAAAAEVGDELIVRRVGKNVIQAQGHDILTAAGLDPLEIGEVGTTQVDRIGAGKDGVEGVETNAAVDEIRGIPLERIMAGLAEQQVNAGAAGERVVGTPAIDRIVAAVSGEHVHHATARDRVSEIRAKGALHADQRVAAFSGSSAERQVDRDGCFRRGIIDSVTARPTVQDIAAWSANQRVRAAAAGQ